MTKVSAVICPQCKAIIFSRARHDFRSCPCGTISIDGGFDYTKLTSNLNSSVPKIFTLSIEQTPMELYDDWNTGADKYGVLPGRKSKIKE